MSRFDLWYEYNILFLLLLTFEVSCFKIFDEISCIFDKSTLRESWVRSIFMPQWICLKGKIRGDPPKKTAISGGVDSSIFFSIFDQFSWKFFWDFFSKFVVQEFFFGPRRIFYASKMAPTGQLFWKNIHFGSNWRF